MPDASPKKKLGLAATLAVALGTTIGAGVFALTETALEHSGARLAWSFVLALLPVLFTLAPIAMLAGAIPTAGGSYRYTARLLTPAAAFGVVWVFAVGTFLGAFPLYSLSCVDYLQSLVGFELPRTLTAIALLTFFYLVNLFGARVAGFVEVALVVLLVAALVLYAVMGLGHAPVVASYPPASLGGVVVGASILSFAYMGGNALIELGHEIRRPGATIPLAMGLCLLITAALYTAVGVGTVRAGADSLLTAAGTLLSPPARVFFIVGGAVTALCTTLNAYFLWGTKSLQALCQDHVLPEGWGQNHSRWHTPTRMLTGIYLLSVLGVALPISRDAMSAFASMSGLIVLIPVLLAAVYLPRRCPQRYRESTVRLPRALVIAAAVIGLLICVAALGSVGTLMAREPWTLLVLFAWSAAGVAIWLARRRQARFQPDPSWT